MNSWNRSLTLFQESLGVLIANPQLIWFPVISSLSSLIALAVLLGPFAISGALKIDSSQSVQWLAVFAVYLITAFITTFFNAGLIVAVRAELVEGRHMTFGEGMAEAGRHVADILVWAMISATVGVILNFISEKTGFIGQIIIKMLGVTWNLVTYFAVPLIILDKERPIASIGRSKELFAKNWGTEVVGNVSMNIIVILLVIPFMLVPMVLGFVTGANPVALVVGLGISASAIIMGSILAATLGSIFNTALFLYAQNGIQPTRFTPELISGAFRLKK